MSVALVSASALVVGVLLYVFLSKRLDKLGDNMASREDVQALAAQVSKVRVEVTGAIGGLNEKIAELEQKIVDGTVTAEDLQPLKDEVQAVDDLIPDAPVVEVPPVDEAPTAE